MYAVWNNKLQSVSVHLYLMYLFLYAGIVLFIGEKLIFHLSVATIAVLDVTEVRKIVDKIFYWARTIMEGETLIQIEVMMGSSNPLKLLRLTLEWIGEF